MYPIPAIKNNYQRVSNNTGCGLSYMTPNERLEIHNSAAPSVHSGRRLRDDLAVAPSIRKSSPYCQPRWIIHYFRCRRNNNNDNGGGFDGDDDKNAFPNEQITRRGACADGGFIKR